MHTCKFTGSTHSLGLLTSHHHVDPLQGALPTPEEIAQKKQLAEARDKLAKALVGEVMDYDRNSPQLAAACVHTLLLMISNVLTDPADEKKRMVRAHLTTELPVSPIEDLPLTSFEGRHVHIPQRACLHRLCADMQYQLDFWQHM